MKLHLPLSTSGFLCAAGLLVAFTTPHLASAQTAPALKSEKAVDGKVYTIVEKMPQLPGGGGSAAIVTAIQSWVTYPAEALKNSIQGRVFVSFVVGDDGTVRDAKIVKGIGGGCDEAVLAAVQQLPHFIPGTQAGRPVAVSFIVPVTFSGKPATTR